jgi:hypothetical protein
MANEELLNQLKSKYQSVLDMIQRQNVRLENLHIENGKLFIRGAAPNDAAKNRVWDQIKAVDPGYSDLTCDIRIDSSIPAPAQTQTAAAGGAASQGRSYTVQPGDTLSKIAKQFYGNANDYMKIFEANRDRLSNPDKIRAGQELVIP